MTATTPPSTTPSPFDKKLSRLQTARDTAQATLDDVTARRAAAVVDTAAVQHAAACALQDARENADAAEEDALRLVATRDRLLAELEQVRAQIVVADSHRAATIEALAGAQQHLAACDAQVVTAGAPFDRWIASLADDVEKYDYRIEQHVARGPGSTALFVGVKG